MHVNLAQCCLPNNLEVLASGSGTHLSRHGQSHAHLHYSLLNTHNSHFTTNRRTYVLATRAIIRDILSWIRVNGADPRLSHSLTKELWHRPLVCFRRINCKWLCERNRYLVNGFAQCDVLGLAIMMFYGFVLAINTHRFSDNSPFTGLHCSLSNGLM